MFSKKLKIIIFGPTPPPFGGVSTYVRHLYMFLKKEQYHVETKSIPLDKNRILNIPKILKAYLSLSMDKNNIVIDNYSFAWRLPFLILPFIALSKLHTKKYFLFIHDGNFPEIIRYYSRVKIFFLKILLRNIDIIICNSTEIKDSLVQQDHYKNKIVILPPLIEYPDSSKKQVPKPIDEFIDSHNPLFISMGAMIEDYGFLKILQAFKKYIIPKQRNAGIILISGGFALNKKYQDGLKKAVLAGLDRNVCMLKDIEPELVFSVMDRTDIFVRATKKEGFGLSVYESAFLGNVPVVSSVKKWPSNFISFKYGDMDDLGKKLLYALKLTKDNEFLKRNKAYVEKVVGKNREVTKKFFSELVVKI